LQYDPAVLKIFWFLKTNVHTYIPTQNFGATSYQWWSQDLNFYKLYLEELDFIFGKSFPIYSHVKLKFWSAEAPPEGSSLNNYSWIYTISGSWNYNVNFHILFLCPDWLLEISILLSPPWRKMAIPLNKLESLFL
jgi:hypothetical protein